MINVIIERPNDFDLLNNNTYNKTKTYINSERPTQYILKKKDIILSNIIAIKEMLNQNKDILDDLPNQYEYIKIPKRKGGYREIVNPSPRLKTIQKNIANFLANILEVHPHNCAHAYIKHRDILTNANIHKIAKMILTLDLHNFFGSLDENTIKTKLLNIINITYYNEINPFIDDILKPCMLNGVLPQGSPASPLISNLVMIEFDELFSNYLLKYNLKYTRYADDMFISGECIEKPKAIEIYAQHLLTNMSQNLKLNQEKTKILRPGNCYLAGIKLNKNNNLTFGHKQKTDLKHKLYNLFVKDINNECTKEEVQEVLGLYAFAHRIEPEYFNYLEKKYLKQFNSSALTLNQHFKSYLV